MHAGNIRSEQIISLPATMTDEMQAIQLRHNNIHVVYVRPSSLCMLCLEVPLSAVNIQQACKQDVCCSMLWDAQKISIPRPDKMNHS